MKMPENELLQPKFELLSLANKSMQNKHAELADREISIFQDLSPAARFMSNLTDEEEEMLMTGINKSELHAQAHLLQIDISKINIDKIE